MSIRTSVKQMLVRQQDKKYEARTGKAAGDLRAMGCGAGKKDCGNSGHRDRGKSRSCGIRDLQAAKGQLAENAVERINAYFVKHPEAEIVYGDEDLLSENGERVIPWFKPCWAPDTYRAFFYVGSVVAVRSRLLQKLGEPGAVTEGESTGREIVFSKAEEIRPLMDRLFLAAGGFERGCHTIGHLEERAVPRHFL